MCLSQLSQLFHTEINRYWNNQQVNLYNETTDTVVHVPLGVEGINIFTDQTYHTEACWARTTSENDQLDEEENHYVHHTLILCCNQYYLFTSFSWAGLKIYK